MMFLKKEVNNLKSEITEKEKLIDNLETENEELKEIIRNLEDKKPYKNYDYAILIKKRQYPKCAFWNKGRFEKDIKELHYNHIAGGMPVIEIIK